MAEKAKAAALLLEEETTMKKKDDHLGDSCLGAFIKQGSWKDRKEFVVDIVRQSIQHKRSDPPAAEDEAKEQKCKSWGR